MWWRDIASLADAMALSGSADSTAVIEAGADIDSANGPVVIGQGTRVCAGAILRGPLVIGSDCLIGNRCVVRGPAVIGDGTRIGYATEIKQARIGKRVAIGPMCFISDSRVDDDAYLGAMVRTSNHRLDRKPVSVREDDETIQTGMEKLGCWIGARASLGIQTIILPGRVIAADSLFEPRITVDRNYPAGHYRISQTLESVSKGPVQ